MKKFLSLFISSTLLLGVTACGTITPNPQYNTILSPTTPTGIFNSYNFNLPDKLNINDFSSGNATISPFNSQLVLITTTGEGDKTSSLTIKATSTSNKASTRVKKQSLNSSGIAFTPSQFELYLQEQREKAAMFLKTSPIASIKRPTRSTVLSEGASEKFFIKDMRNGVNNSPTVKQTFILKKVSEHGYFWVDEEDLKGINIQGREFQVSEENIAKMAEYWESTAYPIGAKYFGGISAVSIDNDKRFNFLISSKLGTKVLGYFSPIDLIGQPTSNNRKVLYINGIFATKELGAKYSHTINSTIIHEFQHFLNFDHKVFQPAINGQQDKIAMEELWLNEALSTLAEQLGGYGLPASEVNSIGMVKSFLEVKPNSPLVTKKYDKFQYGQSYLFSLYLFEQFGGANLINKLYGNYSGIKNVEQATGQAFSNVFKNWVLTLNLDHLTNMPEYNYKSINLRGTYGEYKFNGLKYQEVSEYPFNNNITADNWAVYAYKFNGNGGKLSLDIKTNGKLLSTGVELKD